MPWANLKKPHHSFDNGPLTIKMAEKVLISQRHLFFWCSPPPGTSITQMLHQSGIKCFLNRCCWLSSHKLRHIYTDVTVAGDSHRDHEQTYLWINIIIFMVAAIWEENEDSNTHWMWVWPFRYTMQFHWKISYLLILSLKLPATSIYYFHTCVNPAKNNVVFQLAKFAGKSDSIIAAQNCQL